MRLIDADVFREGILAQSITGKESYPTELICEFLDEQPTAYDVDKVIEQLEEAMPITWRCDYLGGKKDAFVEKIEIVRKGGVE